MGDKREFLQRCPPDVPLLWMGVPIYITVEIIIIQEFSFFNDEGRKSTLRFIVSCPQ